MDITAKGFLLFNTIRYLKLSQVVNQIVIRFKPKEQFWKYAKSNVKFQSCNLWIDGLDNDPELMIRFKPQEQLDNQLSILNETREFNKWQFPDASHLWNFNVHYLEYLVPLATLWKTTGKERYRKRIDQILGNWYEEGSKETDSNQAYTISLRIVNQLIIANAVTDKQKLHDSIYAQYRFLLKHQEKHLLGNHYLENLKAIVISSVVFNEADIYEKYIRKLLEELNEEITTDGLHFELSLMYHKIILEDLIRVAVVLKWASKGEYEDIVAYISKMATALYSLEYGLGRTPLFNDAGNNIAKSTAVLLNTCKRLFSIEPKRLDQIAGYHKLYDGKIAVIIDCGELAPSYMSGHAHCDCLSFELFYDGKPLIVNSGTYQYQGKYRKHFRSTAAHNTAMINGHEQSELWGEHRSGRKISKVVSKREAHGIIGSYKNYLNERHRRKIKLENGVLEVLDQTSGDGCSYLHLAPELKYKDGMIVGRNINIKIKIINAKIGIQNMPYADSFGKLEDSQCLVFSWKNDGERHGYRIVIEGVNDR